MKYAVVTFGCRVNQAESLVIEDGFRARGATASRPEDADVIVVNTCSVTAGADQGARQTVRRIARANPSAKVVLTGCYATRDAEQVSALPSVVQVVPNARKDALVDLIADHTGPTTAERFGEGDGSCGSTLRPGIGGRTTLTLRVQTGCEERCSYCIIPSTRGAGRSKPMEAVVADVHRAVSAGYKELTITGVHLGSYGRDLGDGSSLTSLVRRLAAWTDDVLFRISSLEPMDCTDEIVALAAASPRLAPHFHLPLQHGSDDVLRAMRRPYTSSAYGRLVERVRAAIPHAAIGSDVIVGFPGETDVQFEETHSLLERLPLTYLHVFPYSDRPGTEAAAIRPKVDGLAIRARARRVRLLGERMTRQFRASQAGRRVRALTVDDGAWAVTANYLKVRLDRQYPRNEWIDVCVPES